MGQFNKKEFSEIIRKLHSYMDIEDKVNKIFRENNNETYLSFTMQSFLRFLYFQKCTTILESGLIIMPGRLISAASGLLA